MQGDVPEVRIVNGRLVTSTWVQWCGFRRMDRSLRRFRPGRAPGDGCTRSFASVLPDSTVTGGRCRVVAWLGRQRRLTGTATSWSAGTCRSTATTGCGGCAWCSDCSGPGIVCGPWRLSRRGPSARPRCGPQPQLAIVDGSAYSSRSTTSAPSPAVAANPRLPPAQSAGHVPTGTYRDFGAQVQHFTVETRCSAGEQLTSSSSTVRQHPSDAVSALLNSYKDGAVLTCSPCLHGVPRGRAGVSLLAESLSRRSGRRIWPRR